jgi:hypothetical protein
VGCSVDGNIWSDIRLSACPMPCVRMAEMWPAIMAWSTPVPSSRRERAVLSIASMSILTAWTLDCSTHSENEPHPSKV